MSRKQQGPDKKRRTGLPNRKQRQGVLPRTDATGTQVDNLGRRTTILERLGLGRDDLIVLYKELGTFEDVATRVGVTDRTVRNWFSAFGLCGTRKKPHTSLRAQTSCVSDWLRAHPDAQLPRSVVKCAEMMQLKPAAVEAYIERRRNRVRDYVSGLGDLRQYPKVFVAKGTTKNVHVPPKAIADYTLAVDRWTLIVTYEGVLKAKVKFSLELPYKDAIRFWHEATETDASK